MSLKTNETKTAVCHFNIDAYFNYWPEYCMSKNIQLSSLSSKDQQIENIKFYVLILILSM